jgi:antibiotic biosynthesis monooxygenase (ABM) superfamily enzyme
MFLPVWMAAFVAITAIQAAWGEILASWPLPLRTLLLSGAMVVIIMFLVEPVLSRLLGRPSSRRPPAAEDLADAPRDALRGPPTPSTRP